MIVLCPLFRRKCYECVGSVHHILYIGRQIKVSKVIATTPRCRGGRYTFHLIASFYLWYVPYIAEEASFTIFKVFGMTRPGIEPRSLGPFIQMMN